MNIKVIIQFLMVSFVIFILLLFFFKYFGKNDINQVNNLNVKRDKIATNEMSNFIKDINYTSIDEKGNEYLITAATSEIDIRDSDVMFLDDVISTVGFMSIILRIASPIISKSLSTALWIIISVEKL